MIDDQLP